MADHDTGRAGLPGHRSLPDPRALREHAGSPAGPVLPALPALLGAALREGDVDREAERRAVAAFRAVRDAGCPSAPTRRQDDWRPGGAG